MKRVKPMSISFGTFSSRFQGVRASSMGTTTMFRGMLAALFLATPMTLLGCASSGEGDDGGGDDTVDPPPMGELLIDDLDDGDDTIADVGGRNGVWYTYGDTTAGASMEPAEGAEFKGTADGAGGSAYYAKFKGTGYKEWGAGLAFDLKIEGEGAAEMKKPWDASPYKGITFKAKGNVPIRVGLATTAVLTAADGGTCVPAMPEMDGMMCDDSHGKSFTLTAEWKTYTLNFADARQEGWGFPVAFDAKTLMGLQFNIGPNVTWEIGIDDVGLIQ